MSETSGTHKKFLKLIWNTMKSSVRSLLILYKTTNRSSLKWSQVITASLKVSCCANLSLISYHIWQHRTAAYSSSCSPVVCRTNMCTCLVIDSPQAHQSTWESRTSWCWWPWCSPTWSTRWTRPLPTSSSNPCSFHLLDDDVMDLIGFLAMQDV